tara:strand:+ start:11649 stop:11816 length:168 start_codon:yes stop_codon:yes gene_type:complete
VAGDNSLQFTVGHDRVQTAVERRDLIFNVDRLRGEHDMEWAAAQGWLECFDLTDY